MRKFMIIAIICVMSVGFCLFPAGVAAYAQTSDTCVKNSSRSACLIDFDTGKVLYERNADAELPIASMVKIMTLLLTFEKIDSGTLCYDTEVTVSENAAGMGGSQMFLSAGSVYTVDELIKGITVCSANDASVAMAETIAGNTESFVELMNKRAAELGMSGTVFVNATGLPAEGQHSTARDVSCMMRQLLSHDKYFEYSGITLENYTHPDGRVTQMVNTNKLLRNYKDCDAGKTGFTNAAMFCLSASAKRGDLRVIATVIGAPDSKSRFAEVSSLFNFGFANYECVKLVSKDDICRDTVPVRRGEKAEVAVRPAEDIKVLRKKGEQCDYVIDVVPLEKPNAPIYAGDILGHLTVKDTVGNSVGEVDLIAVCDVPEISFPGSLHRVLGKWFLGRGLPPTK